MLFEITEQETLKRVSSEWRPMELEVEKYIVSSDGKGKILDAAIFGEELLIVKSQAGTKVKKRADILAMDCFGNGVIIELKRDRGSLGVETQALQYLADFSAYKGQSFINHFSNGNDELGEDIHSFIGGNASINDLNKTSRIILLARDFDETLYSMGEWLSNNGVAFRCIKYEPIEIDNNRYISFSVTFDRSKEILHPLALGSIAREPGHYWHNIARNDQKSWEHLIYAKQIPASFDNAPGDQGEKLLRSYITGDVIIAYANKYGAIGWGEIENDKPDSYKLVESGSSEDYWNGKCLHRLSINWKSVALNLNDGIRPSEVREKFDIYHPIPTSVKIDSTKAKKLMDLLDQRYKNV